MAKKDYWFPFRFESFLASTNGWDDDQVGAYLRLLIYQFQNGFIPSDLKKISKISFSAKKHWNLLSTKFIEGKGGLYNEVMDDIRTLRTNQWETAAENGKKGGRPRRNTEKNETESETQPLTENGSRIENKLELELNKEENYIKEGGKNEGIAWDMIEAFKVRFPHYWVDKEKDPMAVMQIANKLADKNGFQKYEIISIKRKEIVKEWEKIVDFAASDKWFSTRSISDLNKEWQRLLQSYVPTKATVLNISGQSNSREELGSSIISDALKFKKSK